MWMESSLHIFHIKMETFVAYKRYISAGNSDDYLPSVINALKVIKTQSNNDHLIN